jgi:hypothetical protein
MREEPPTARQSAGRYRVGISQRGASLLTLRGVIVVVGLAVGATLIVRGQILLGCLIAGGSVLRGVFIVSLVGRRRGFGRLRGGELSSARRDAFGQPWRGGTPRGILRRLARAEFAVAARAIGTSPGELRRSFQQGRSIAESAEDAGVAVHTVVDAVIRDASAKIDLAVANGSLSSASADHVKARLPTWAARLVDIHQGELRARRRLS